MTLLDCHVVVDRTTVNKEEKSQLVKLYVKNLSLHLTVTVNANQECIQLTYSLLKLLSSKFIIYHQKII